MIVMFLCCLYNRAELKWTFGSLIMSSSAYIVPNQRVERKPASLYIWCPGMNLCWVFIEKGKPVLQRSTADTKPSILIKRHLKLPPCGSM